jgi:ABC-type amino acid transport substrate-binding protein
MILILTDTASPRLDYIVRLLFVDISGLSVVVTTDRNEWLLSTGPRINYTKDFFDAASFHIHPQGLLFEQSIRDVAIDISEVHGMPVFFSDPAGDFPFDIFSASFFLVSRYEEYLPHVRDAYGRFDARSSLAFRASFLHLPMVEIWANELRSALMKRFPGLVFPAKRFSFLPTYDIDIAYAHAGRGAFRTISGGIHSLLSGRFDLMCTRFRVIAGREKDPYDSYDFLNGLHDRFGLSAIFFILAARNIRGYDRNLSAQHPALQQLVRQLADRYEVGVHPSWQSGDHPGSLTQEIKTVGDLCGKAVHSSRQHYIRLAFPYTYRHLLANGIGDDYSMGYATINGFRASVSSSFLWYDLENDRATALRIHPFCYMDANAFHELRMSPEEAFSELSKLYLSVRKVNGCMIGIWHNSMLGTDPMYAGWREVYVAFLEMLSVGS